MSAKALTFFAACVFFCLWLLAQQIDRTYRNRTVHNRTVVPNFKRGLRVRCDED
jgi:hypothetical protein